MLKQIDKDMLLDAMIRLRGRLDRKRRDSLEADAIFGDLFDLLDSDSEEEIGAFYAGKAKALYPHYRIVNALYPADDEFGAAGELVEAKGISGFAIRTGMHKQTILLNSDDSDPNALANFVDERLSAAAHIGISCAGLADASLSRLYREADVALYTSVFYPQLRLAHYRENAPIAGAAGLLLQLELGIREQKPDSVTRCLRELSEACLNQKPFVDQVAGLCNQIVSLVQKYYGSDGGPHPVEFLSYSQLGKSGRSAEELFERLRAFMDREAAPDIPIVHEQVKSVMAYIDARFTEDLMLGAIAKQFNVSLGYLSYLLKRETGKTFSEYIAYRRIALAKELLADGSLSVQEIVQRVGYKDYFHFNKLFKKHVGVTPSKFRKL
ncbi:helix-turn-helix transcriptional regulator [Paenibacillus sp. B01]|uniref:helix-turn-helix transcriptional regulator n=1 Tax=Paenibacillus sp. B01 TaxID=2660554 RepID=UPI0022649C27|nr:helix-turn-helix domain-containing protein [Paenibacillus sp. B01]